MGRYIRFHLKINVFAQNFCKLLNYGTSGTLLSLQCDGCCSVQRIPVFSPSSMYSSMTLLEKHSQCPLCTPDQASSLVRLKHPPRSLLSSAPWLPGRVPPMEGAVPVLARKPAGNPKVSGERPSPEPFQSNTEQTTILLASRTLSPRLQLFWKEGSANVPVETGLLQSAIQLLRDGPCEGTAQRRDAAHSERADPAPRRGDIERADPALRRGDIRGRPSWPVHWPWEVQRPGTATEAGRSETRGLCPRDPPLTDTACSLLTWVSKAGTWKEGARFQIRLPTGKE